MILGDYKKHQKRLSDLLDEKSNETDSWQIVDDEVLVNVEDNDIMNDIQKMVRVRTSNFFNRVDTEQGPLFQNYVEITLSVDDKGMWFIVEVTAEFISTLTQNRSISFGTPDRKIVVPFGDDDDIESMGLNWRNFHDDDIWFSNNHS